MFFFFFLNCHWGSSAPVKNRTFSKEYIWKIECDYNPQFQPAGQKSQTQPRLRACCVERTARAESRRNSLLVPPHFLMPGIPIPSCCSSMTPQCLSHSWLQQAYLQNPWRWQLLILASHVLTPRNCHHRFFRFPQVTEMPLFRASAGSFPAETNGSYPCFPWRLSLMQTIMLAISAVDSEAASASQLFSWSFLSGTNFLSHPQIRTFQ